MMWLPKVISRIACTLCSRNPAKHSEFMGPLPHFFLMFGRVTNPYSHLQASLRGKRTFDTDIITLPKTEGAAAAGDLRQLFAVFLTCSCARTDGNIRSEGDRK